MVRVPTVTLERANGQRLKVDRYEYATNVNRYVNKGYKIVGEKRGEATTEENKTHNREIKIQRERERSVEREKQFGDKERAYKERAIELTSDDVEPPPRPAAVNPDWSTMPWFTRRLYVEEVTGELPKTAKHARELMELHKQG